MKTITIVDYGVGNLQSIKKALAKLGAAANVSEDAQALPVAEAVILPGVGAFASGMRGLAVRGLTDAVRRFAESGRPMLGICLGAQLLLEKGFEFGEHEGLGIIPGRVERFPFCPLPLSEGEEKGGSERGRGEKVPHVGWNRVEPGGASWARGIFQSFGAPFDAYFVHSFILVPAKKEHILGCSRYGGFSFCSAVQKGSVFGTQFHPEKSGESGMEIMKNFLTLVS